MRESFNPALSPKSFFIHRKNSGKPPTEQKVHLFANFKRRLINAIRGFRLIDVNMKVEELGLRQKVSDTSRKQTKKVKDAQEETDVCKFLFATSRVHSTSSSSLPTFLIISFFHKHDLTAMSTNCWEIWSLVVMHQLNLIRPLKHHHSAEFAHFQVVVCVYCRGKTMLIIYFIFKKKRIFFSVLFFSSSIQALS